jgi:uncharacterized protein (DUF342 family)/predicted RNA-binding protein Jag
MQSIVSKGKDIHEAINLGLDLLETTKKEVDIEIIQYEKKGFLGIGTKSAIVKLTKLETSYFTKNNEGNDPKQPDLENVIMAITDEQLEDVETYSREQIAEKTPSIDNEINSLEGKVWVKDGQLQCKSSPAQFPMITLKSGIKLYKNNQHVTENTTIVSEKELYELRVENEEKETKWDITMDENKLKVLLVVEPGYKIVRTIPDINADEHIEIAGVEQKYAQNSLEYGAVIQKLESLRVKYGINQNEILKALEATEPSTFEIAAGMKATPGKEGWVEIIVDMNTQDGPKEKENGSVDYREIKEIPTVKRGTVIAIVHPPVPGKSGYTVRNELLPAKQTSPIILNTGKGVILVDDKIVAKESGRPFIERRGQLVKVSIMPKLVHRGNVDLESGNIRFTGDVEVTGEVENRMIVEAEGDILVHQNVSNATITASGAIVTYGNIIGSELSAGKNNMLITELGHILGILHQHTEQMIKVIKQLEQSSAFKSNDVSKTGLQPLIRILLEKKFKGFPSLAKKYVEVVRRGEDYLQDDIWRVISVGLSQLFLSMTSEITSLSRIIHLSKQMKELSDMSNTPIEPDSYITIPYALNSVLYCSGDIKIFGQGCVNTKIHTGGKLTVNGAVRGGEVYGRLGVQINEAGSESGTLTIIAVPNDQKIKIGKAMDGTILKFGNIKYALKEPRLQLLARLGDNGRVIFE